MEKNCLGQILSFHEEREVNRTCVFLTRIPLMCFLSSCPPAGLALTCLAEVSVSGSFLKPSYSVVYAALSAHKYVGNAAGCVPFHPWNYFPTASGKRCVSLQSQHTFKLTRCKISRSYNLKTPTNEANCVNIQNIWPFSQSILFTCRLAHCQVHIV